MSKNYKVKHEKEITNEINDENMSKKELYDLKKKEKEALKQKNAPKKKKKKKQNKTYKTNTIGRIFAIIMLLLMIGSVIATISYSFH